MGASQGFPDGWAIQGTTQSATSQIRTFVTGATRDTVEGKPDYAGFLSPLVVQRFGEYMMQHQIQSDGTRRASDNWKKGIPKREYLASGWRHFLDVWLHLDGHGEQARGSLEDSLCAMLFNMQGLLHEVLKETMQGGAA